MSLFFPFPLKVPTGPGRNLAASIQSPYSTMLTWDPPLVELQNGVIIGYMIQLSVAETGAVSQVTSPTTSVNITTNAFRTYTCVVSAQTAVGFGPYGSQTTFLTPEDG